jgi:hypothetical protein
MLAPNNEVLMCVMGMHVFNRLVTPDVPGRFKQLYDRLGADRFVTFMCDGVASALTGVNSTAFQQLLMAWYDRLGPKRFTTFMCNSVASALNGEHAATFQERLMVWFTRLGADRFTTFMCGGVASALVGEHAETFQERLIAWFTRLGDKRFTTFMCDSVASGLAGEHATLFNERALFLLQLMGPVDFVNVVNGGVAARVLESQFYEDLKTVYSELTIVERGTFCKFFVHQIAAIRDLGPTMFWATVKEICGQPASTTQKESRAMMKRKRELNGETSEKKMKK